MRRCGWYRDCPVCGKPVYVTPSLDRKGRGIYCSASCRSKVVVYKMLSVRKPLTVEQRKGVSDKLKEFYKNKENHPRWKGDSVGYFALHDWVEKMLGRPKACSVCGLSDASRMYHWANLSGKYLRREYDWKRMCVSCHRKFDYEFRRKNKELEIAS